MPKSAASNDTRAKDKAQGNSSSVKKTTRSRSRGRGKEPSSVTDDSSRASSPGRRGRPPGRGRSRSPARTTKTTSAKTEVTTSTSARTWPSSTVVGQADTNALLRSSKKPEVTVADGQNHHGTVPNGTHHLTVSIEPLMESYVKKLRSADPRPKINTTIFDNIQLTPSTKAASGIGEKPITEGKVEIKERVRMAEKLATPVPSKQTSKQRQMKLEIQKFVVWARKLMGKCYAMLPSWKVMLAFLLMMLIVFLCVYIYFYQREAVTDYSIIIKEQVRRKWNSWNQKEL